MGLASYPAHARIANAKGTLLALTILGVKQVDRFDRASAFDDAIAKSEEATQARQELETTTSADLLGGAACGTPAAPISADDAESHGTNERGRRPRRTPVPTRRSNSTRRTNAGHPALPASIGPRLPVSPDPRRSPCWKKPCALRAMLLPAVTSCPIWRRHTSTPANLELAAARAQRLPHHRPKGLGPEPRRRHPLRQYRAGPHRAQERRYRGGQAPPARGRQHYFDAGPHVVRPQLGPGAGTSHQGRTRNRSGVHRPLP